MQGTEQLDELNIEQFNQLFIKMVKLHRRWEDGSLDFLRKAADGCYNDISLNSLHKIELCEQPQATKAAFRECKNWRMEMMYALHSIAPTIVTDRMNYEGTRIFASRKPSQRYHRRQSMRSFSFRRAHECVKDIPVFSAGIRYVRSSYIHTLTTWTKAFTDIHACGRDFPIPHFPYSACSDENTLLCNCEVFSVSSQTHERKRWGQTTRLAIFKWRIKDESFACVTFSTQLYPILSVGWWIRYGLDWGFLIFTLLRPGE